MNKILKSLCLFTLMVFAMTGCREDAELAGQGTPGNPEKEVIGKYTGTFFVTLDENTTEYEGSVTITEDGQYAATVHIECPGRKLDSEVKVNVMKQSPNIRFYNEIPDNPLGSAFAGLVTPQGNLTMDFKKTEREGRKSYVFKYVFDGNR